MILIRRLSSLLLVFCVVSCATAPPLHTGTAGEKCVRRASGSGQRVHERMTRHFPNSSLRMRFS